MKKRTLQSLNGQDGSVLLEFAFVFILFMTMVFGIGGFGHALYAYHFVNHAAKEATRFAAVHGSACASDKSCASPAGPSDVTAFVASIVPPGINPSGVTTKATWPVEPNGPAACGAGTPNAPGCTAQVQVSYKLAFIFPLISASPWTLSSTSQMIIAH